MSSKQSETPRRGVGTDIGGGKWTISNTTKGTTGCNCALYQSTCKTLISGKHSLRRASGKIQMPGAFTGTASSTTWQMEKMRRAFSPLYESRRQLFANAFMASSQTLEARVIEHVAAARLDRAAAALPSAGRFLREPVCVHSGRIARPAPYCCSVPCPALHP